MNQFKKTMTALITPFKNQKIDMNSFEKLVRHQLENGVEGFVINGTTAESPNLNKEERRELFDCANELSGNQIQIVVGTGSNSTEKTIKETQEALELGADAALIVVPYYNKPPQRGLYQHYKAISENVDIPIILYNVPGRTITSLSIETIADLSKLRNIIGIKEASGNIDFAKQIHQQCGDEFVLLSGDDGTYVEFLKAGGHGVISVATHVIPQQMIQWKKWVHTQQAELAEKDIQIYKKLIDMLFMEANPIPVKKACELMGLIESAELRMPLTELETKNTEILKLEMKKLGII